MAAGEISWRKWLSVCVMLAFCNLDVGMANVKTEVVSVRVEPPIKAALQLASEREMRSLANMIEVMVVAYCRAHGYPLTGVPDETLASSPLRGNTA